MEFVVDEVAREEAFHQVLRIFTINIIPLLLSVRIYPLGVGTVGLEAAVQRYSFTPLKWTSGKFSIVEEHTNLTSRQSSHVS
jgi:hypothetical protein